MEVYDSYMEGIEKKMSIKQLLEKGKTTGKLTTQEIDAAIVEMVIDIEELDKLYETIESLPLVVIKRDGSRQSFDKVKLINGMVRACEKRPVSLSQLENIADEIEQELQSGLEREVRTVDIGEMVMSRLKDVDEVAYVRFASVYRSFKDINTFMEELSKLLTEK